MALSLAQRKNIRDAMTKAEASIEKIKEATGLDFVVEVDVPTVLAQIPADRKESYAASIGDVIYEYYLGELAYGLEYFCKDPLQKEAVVDLATARKIGFSVVPNRKEWEKLMAGTSSYCRARLVDGVIVMEVNGENFCSNTSDIRSGLEKTFSGSGPLSLKCRTNINQNAEKVQELMEQFETATGAKFELEVDYAGLLGSISADRKSDLADSMGDFVIAYLDPFVRNFGRNCENEMNKEALLDLATTRKVKFHIFKDDKEYKKAANWGSSYGRCRVVNGDIVIELNNTNLYANVDYIFEFEQTFAGNGPLSLKCRANIAKNAEKVQEFLDQFETATGAKWELEVDYAGLLGSMSADRKADLADSMGDFVLAYVEPFVRTFARACETDDMNKEAILEIASTRKIKFHIFKDDKEYKKAASFGGSYGRCRVVNGDCVIELNNTNLYANVDYIYEFDQTFSGA